jgi:hypothetical protein
MFETPPETPGTEIDETPGVGDDVPGGDEGGDEGDAGGGAPSEG